MVTYHIHETLGTSAAHNGEFKAIYRMCKAYTEGEISEIMWRDVFCAHKPFFLMPGHK